MKEKLAVALSGLLLVFVCLFIYSCQEDYEEPNATAMVVPDDLLNAAKEWHLQNTQGDNNSSRLSNSKRYVLPPTWKDAALHNLKNGKTQIVVPSPEFALDTRSTAGVVRKFVFDQDNGKITRGRIVEIFTDAGYAVDHKSNLLESYENGDLNNFTGSVIVYDVNYNYSGSFVYKNGKLIPGWSRIRPKLPAGNKSGRALNDCWDYWWVIRYADGTETWVYLYTICYGEDNEYGGDGGGSGGASGGGGDPGPSFPSNPQNNQEFSYLSFNDGIFTKWRYSTQNQMWIVVERALPLPTVNIVAPSYPKLASIPYPEPFEVAYEVDGLQYIYDPNSNSWNGILNTPATWVNHINDLNLKPCMQAILAGVENISEGKMGQVIQMFSGYVPGYNWEMKDGLLDPGVNASTSTNYNSITGTVSTTFDATKMTNASDLSIARTILHESIHAYVIAVTYNNLTDPVQKAALLGPDWLTAFDNYGHDYMTTNYLQPIADALQQYGNTVKSYGLSSQFYQDLAWGGLTDRAQRDSSGQIVRDVNGNIVYEESPLFISRNPNPSDRSRIKNTINTELGVTNTSNQQGTDAGC